MLNARLQYSLSQDRLRDSPLRSHNSPKSRPNQPWRVFIFFSSIQRARMILRTSSSPSFEDDFFPLSIFPQFATMDSAPHGTEVHDLVSL